MPSAGTIFNLKIVIDSYHRNHRRRHSPAASPVARAPENLCCLSESCQWHEGGSRVSRIARAQTYPTRPVRIIVGFAPGGAPDMVARLMRQWLSERLGQQFIVENRPGAGTNIATEAVVRAPARQ
jgi:hypothetical protein